MRSNIILLVFAFSFAQVPTAEAQILKKLKEKLSKTDKNNEEDNSGSGEEGQQSPTAEEQEKRNQKMGNLFGSGLEDIPDTYTFSYSLVYELTTNKESMPLEYLLEPEANYFANIMGDEETEQLMVYDFKKNAMVMFMENEGQKMAMKMTMPNAKKMQKKFGKKIIPDEKEEEVDIIPIKGKTILGYECDGYQVTSKDGVGQFWVTNDAPVTINEVFANFKSLPKKARNYPLSVKSLILEMNYTANRGKKDNMTMLCTKLEEQALKINKADYKSGN